MKIYVAESFWEASFAYTGDKLRKDEARALGYMVKNWAMGRDPAITDEKLTKRQCSAIAGLLRSGLVVRIMHDIYPIDTIRACIGETVFPCSILS
jgi:hypothetical protein